MKRVRIIMYIAIIIVLTLLMSHVYMRGLYTDTENTHNLYLLEAHRQLNQTISDRFAREADSFDFLATLVEGRNGDVDYALTLLKKTEDTNNTFPYHHCGVLLEDGTSYDTIGGIHTDVVTRQFTKAQSTGRWQISAPYTDKYHSLGTVVATFTPVTLAGGQNACLYAVLTTESLANMLTMDYFSGEGEFVITNTDGAPILFSKKDSALNSADTTDEDRTEFQRIVTDTRHTETVCRWSEYYVSSMRMTVNNWSLVAVVPDAVVGAQTRLIIRSAVILCLGVGVAAVLIFLLILWQRKKSDERSAIRAKTDELTGLPNGVGFHAQANACLEKNADCSYALVSFDVNNFSKFNALYGYLNGTSVIMHIANKLKENLRENEVAAHINSDDFLWLIRTDTIPAGERIQQFDKAIHPVWKQVAVVLSYGICEIPKGNLSLMLLRDRALSAKRSIKGNYEKNIAFYDAMFHQQQIANDRLVRDMEQAITNQEFLPYYQPKFDIRTQEIIGAEALVRWHSAGGEIKMPGRFVNLLEANGRIVRLDFYMYEKVCAFLADLQRWHIRPIPVSVNFSRAHLYDEGFVDHLAEIADRYGVPHHLLEVELTESVFEEDATVVARLTDELHAQNFEISIDDFGSGYSSLNMLKDVRFDTLKIDRQFLAETVATERSRVVVQAVLHVARGLHIKTVAEGVETREQVAFLAENGCDAIQGFYYSPAIPEEEFTQRLAAADMQN